MILIFEALKILYLVHQPLFPMEKVQDQGGDCQGVTGEEGAGYMLP